MFEDLALFMDSKYVTGTPTSDTSYVLLTVDTATIADTPIPTNDFITAKGKDPE